MYDSSKRRAFPSPCILSARSNRKKAVFILKQSTQASGLSAGWMSHADPHSQTHHSNGVIYVDAGTKYNVHVDVSPHKTGLWRCSSGGSMHRDTAFYLHSKIYIHSERGRRFTYLACHISSLATCSQDAGWKLFIHKGGGRNFFI